jgi:site-specific DNA-methyltransferase (adenine-specific)/adenine-specific DNA-methyltransferase
MTEEFKQMVIDALRRGDELPREWARKLFPPEKREYELVYYGKEREEDIIADTMALPLQPVSTFGNNGERWHNMLIFGDNLQAMKTLLIMKEEQKLINANGKPGVKLVYIDPPFASKQEFEGSEAQKAYQDKISGARFLEFLRKRLVLLKELLSDDGTLYMHLDYRKLHYLKALVDEVFGENNFMNEVIWCYRERGISRTFWNNKHQTILVWAKNLGSQAFNADAARIPYSQEYLKKFKYEDEDGKYQIRGKNIQGSPVQRADGLTPEAEKKYPGLTYRQYLKDGQLPLDWWELPLLNKAAHERTGYPTQKPESLLRRIIKASSDKGDLVLDCFAGSGTTLAAAEKLDRRWIGIDCGKLSIYTVQKRMLNIKQSYDLEAKEETPHFVDLARELLNQLKHAESAEEKLHLSTDTIESAYNRELDKPNAKPYGKNSKPFVLYNAGLYDFSSLKALPWADWRFFALQLFGCKDEPHAIGGLNLDGKLKGASVLVFNHVEQPGRRIDEETIQDIHLAVGKRIGRKFFIIAPRGVFDFQQDYIDLDGVRYYALRIPYSVINELHHRDFTALQQPNDESAVNDTVDAVGFDFIQPPQVKWDVSVKKHKGEMFDEACLKIKHFESRARIRGKDTRGGLETLSMLMLDFDYDGKVFDLDAVFYAHQLEADDWQAWFPTEKVGEKLMAVFIDIYGNEARELITPDTLGTRPKKSSKPKKKTRK